MATLHIFDEFVYISRVRTDLSMHPGPHRHIPEEQMARMLALLAWCLESDAAVSAAKGSAALLLWIEHGLPYNTAPDGTRLFDPIEVFNFSSSAPPLPGDLTYSHYRSEANRVLVANLAAPSPRDLPGGWRRFTVELSRTFNIAEAPRGEKLRLRMPLPIEGENLTSIQVKPFDLDSGGGTLRIGPGRLELRTVAQGQATIAFGARIDFIAREQKPVPNPSAALPDRDVYLAPREGLITVSDRVRHTALSLAPESVPPIEAVRAFWEFIYSRSDGSVSYDQIDLEEPCDWVLEHRRYDCQLRAVMLIALCRGRGIPARQVGGFILHPQCPSKHYWAEVWIDGQGWTPFDLFYLGGENKTDEDRAWRDRFFGQLEYRMVCERLPRDFTGALGVPIPKAWMLVQVQERDGIETGLAKLDGTPIFTDFNRVL